MSHILPPASKTLLLLAKCVPSLKQGAAKFKVKRMELDINLNMYFSKHEYVYAHDPKQICKSGDLVLIEMLPEKLTRLITHKVKEVIYPMGDITDPLTGKKVMENQYRDDMDVLSEVYGKVPNSFKYEKAPKRGWQENKKDFTHLETYIKYHDDGTEDPRAV